MADLFRFKRFSVSNERSALKVGTDAVLLGAAMNIPEKASQALDIGTGTGVIALMAAQRNEKMQICAIDIDAASAEEAAENFRNSPWQDRLTAINIRLQDYRPELKFDFVFSNPPYFLNSLKNPDKRESGARHNDSLEIKDIFAFCREYLDTDGCIALILPSEQAKNAKMLGASFGFRPCRELLIHSSAKKAPKRVILEFSKELKPYVSESLCLHRDGGKSEEYKILCEDFYLW